MENKLPVPCASDRIKDYPRHRAIICRTFGVAVPDWARIDSDGFATFSLDPAKHDPFDVFDRMKAAVDNAA